MLRYFLPLLLACAGLTVGLVLADQPGEGDEPPLRLRKKKKGPDVPPEEKKKEGPKVKPKEDKDEELVPEDGKGGAPEEDEKEVLARVQKNMRAAEEKLANKELGEPTLQTQRDRSEEHTSELQSQSNLVCRLLLEKKKHKYLIFNITYSKKQNIVNNP